ncbi:hypothetical protein NEUTE1DRAFT_136820 [Neurospora tetrasperma FGSC 2508]|uniref:Uncharacterized protein n=1 Tax=Neurospora tetrasperma (strain FGSC 2508 / ATCC MYA-4615 / P0657) TaxID=510951 RepID=F8MIC9_NEUT8|nr:uncharacterized protein NEUTE1DRAFT_136820 [Neurospora tetrasperma FGSC 2508]EGO59783.1 hypothetical protein NEUTE1DRAFT_136820 [Neurospora tetrasperma FGSC 2508]EGZ73930.1 hypothetical protein NEUTE2DRAFT_166004 [Neurospora tetrasperma FGSC 2509]
MSYHELLNVIESIEDGLFDSLIESLNSLPNSNTEKWWETLAGKVADCQTEWNKWYAAYLECERFLQNENQWKGNGQYSYVFLTQTVTELCTALEALARWTKKLTTVSKFLAEGRDVEIIDQDQTSTTVTKTIKDARVEAVKRIFTVACRLLDCQRFKDLMKGEEAKTQKQLEEVESRTTAAVVEEMHSAFYLDVLGADLGITNPEAMERYLRALLPQSFAYRP